MESSKKLVDFLEEAGFLKTQGIIEAFRKIDRKDFVLEQYRDEMYGNYPLPIGYGQTISQPATVAFMLELLQPELGDKILDVGTGSGWTTALLAHCVGQEGRVIAIELIPELKEFGEKNVSNYNFVKRGIVEFLCADGSKGYSKEAPFDRILCSAAAQKRLPEAWREQLKIGGRIVVPIDSSVWLFGKKSQSEFMSKEYPGFAFVPLVNKE